MAKFIIKGQQKLSGEIKVNGAKNLALKVIPAAILLAEPMVISNMPRIEDTEKSLELMSAIGFKVEEVF